MSQPSIDALYPNLAEKIKQARSAGYDDAEIEAFIGQKVQTAKEAGYSDEEITAYIGTPTNQSKGVAGDMGRMLGAGLDQLGILGGIGMQKVGLDKAGRYVEDVYRGRLDKMHRELSPEQQAANQQRFVEKTEDGYRPGPGLTSPRKIAGTIFQSAPAMALGMGGGAAITRGLIAKGLSPAVAGVAGGAVGEGGVAGALNYVEVYDGVRNAPIEELGQTPEFQEAFASLSDEPEGQREELAREKVASSLALKAAGLTALSTAVLGAPSGAALGKILGGETGKGFIRTAMKQGVLESLQEAPQEAAETYITSQTGGKVNPALKASPLDMLEATVGGGVTGFAMGLGGGAGGQMLSPKQATSLKEYTEPVKDVVAPPAQPSPRDDSGQLGPEIPNASYDPVKAGLQEGQAGPVIPQTPEAAPVEDPETFIDPNKVSNLSAIAKGIAPLALPSPVRQALPAPTQINQPGAFPLPSPKAYDPRGSVDDVMVPMGDNILQEVERKITNIQKTPEKNRTPKQQENLVSLQQKKEEVLSNREYVDPRLKRPEYRDWAGGFLRDNVEEDGSMVGKVTGADDLGRGGFSIPSSSSPFMQPIIEVAGGIPNLKKALAKATSGAKAGRGQQDMGPNQVEAVRQLLNVMERQRIEAGLPEALKKRAEARARRQAAKWQPGEIFPLTFTDDELFAGEQYDEAAYAPEWDEEARNLFELAQDARAIDPVRADAILESQEDDSIVARNLWAFIKENENGRESASRLEAATGTEDATAEDPEDAGADRGTPEATQPAVALKKGEDGQLFATPPTFGKKPQGQNNATLDDLDLYSQPLIDADNARQGDMFAEKPATQTSPLLEEAKTLQYKTPHLKSILDREALGSTEEGFFNHLLEIAMPKARIYDEIMRRYNGKPPMGVEFKHAKDDRYATLLPDASSPGKFRVQYFDKGGFASHDTFNSLQEATDEMLKGNFTVEDKGALKRLSKETAWEVGSKQVVLIQRLNRGEISHKQYIEKMEAIQNEVANRNKPTIEENWQEKKRDKAAGERANALVAEGEARVEAVAKAMTIGKPKSLKNVVIMKVFSLSGEELQTISAPHDGTVENIAYVSAGLRGWAGQNFRDASMRESAIVATDNNGDVTHEVVQGEGMPNVIEKAKPAAKKAPVELPQKQEVEEISLETHRNLTKNLEKRGTVKGWAVMYDDLRGSFRLMRKRESLNEAGGGYVWAEQVYSFPTEEAAKAWATEFEEQETAYHRGDKVAFTNRPAPEGFRAFVYLEGHKKGQYGVMPTPEAKAADLAMRQEEYKEQQAGFTRLHQKQESNPFKVGDKVRLKGRSTVMTVTKTSTTGIWVQAPNQVSGGMLEPTRLDYDGFELVEESKAELPSAEAATKPSAEKALAVSASPQQEALAALGKGQTFRIQEKDFSGYIVHDNGKKVRLVKEDGTVKEASKYIKDRIDVFKREGKIEKVEPAPAQGATGKSTMDAGPEKSVAEKKQPWEMTQAEYLSGTNGVDEIAIAKMAHAQHVKQAVNDRKDVPAQVLEHYRLNGWAQKALTAKAAAENNVSFDDMVAEAARWKGATQQVAQKLAGDKKTQLYFSRMTTKADLDAYLMRKFGIGETEARDVSNWLTANNVPADMTAEIDGFADEPWGAFIPQSENAPPAAPQEPSAAQPYTEEGDKPGKKKAPQPSQPTEKIEDFGEKIGGARKDIFSAYAETMKDAEQMDVATVPLSKSWPEPDYQKLLEGGADPFIVAFIRAAREEVPNKPQKKWRVKEWAKKVKELRDLANGLLDGTYPSEVVKAKAKESSVLEGMLGRVELYQEFGHGKSLKGISFQKHHYAFYNGEKNVTRWSIDRPAKASALSNWPQEIAVGKTKEEALAIFRQKYESLGTSKESSGVSFEVYQYRRNPGTYWIGKKVGKDYIDLKSFGSLKEAKDYQAQNQVELESLLERRKKIPEERRSENRERVGADHRNGRDVTPMMFQDAFGFRGVEFGNWVNSQERQDNLNRAYDALLDLAEIIGVPSQALSLNGELGLAFGARGVGGKRAPSAHYEPGKIVINLTKKNGPGSLAHEWLHALDNYFSRNRGYKDDYLSKRPYALMNETTRPEVLAAFKNVMAAIKATGMKKRSARLDSRRTKPYWGTDVELAARAFENYIIEKAKEKGGHNDYLANIVSLEEYGSDMLDLLLSDDGLTVKDMYPYLTEGEIPAVRDAFNHLFDTLEVRQTPQGTALFSKADQWREANDAVLFDGQGIGKAKADETLAPIMKAWKGAPSISILNDATELPDNLRALAQYQAEVIEGLFDPSTQKVYLLADNLSSPEAAQRVLLHEVIGHFGLRSILGKDLDAVLRQVYDVKRKEVLAMAEARGLDLNTERGRLLAAEEVLATMAGENQGQGFLRRTYAALRNFLRKMGFTLNLNDADLRQLIADSARFVTTGKGEVSFVGGGVLKSAAWHGSPHAFDKFSTAHIGTGEGAQAYGYGLYFAGNKEVAEYYKNKLSAGLKYDGKKVKRNSGYKTEDAAAWAVFLADGDKETAKRSGLADPELIDAIDPGKLAPDGGRLYHVELAPKDDEYLLWDKPLSEQSEKVREALNNLAEEYTKDGDTKDNFVQFAWSMKSSPEMIVGKNFYSVLSRHLSQLSSFDSMSREQLDSWYEKTVGYKPTEDDPNMTTDELRSLVKDIAGEDIVKSPADKRASEYLHSLGIRGIKYLDGSSRGKGDGNYNYVIFSDEDVEIKGLFSKAPKDTILIDGVPRPTKNSNGQPLAQTEEGIRNFWKWFGDSKVVDENGEPLVVYHGTMEDFDSFDTGKTGMRTGNEYGDGAIFFTSNRFAASAYANTTMTGPVRSFDDLHPLDRPNVVPAFISMQNPRGVDARGASWVKAKKAIEEAQGEGYDGVIIRNVLDHADPMTALEEGPIDVFVAFDPTQVKSVNNSGTFDPETPNILFSKRGDGFEVTVYQRTATGEKQVFSQPVATHEKARTLQAKIRRNPKAYLKDAFDKNAEYRFSVQGGTPLPPRPRSGFGLPKSSLMKFPEPVRNAVDYLRMKFQDKFIPLLRVQEMLEKKGWVKNAENDAYRAEELFHGKAGDRLDVFNDDMVTPLLDAIKDSSVTLEELERYLYAKFAPQRNAHIAEINKDMPDGGSGMTNEEAANILAAFSRDGKTAELERLAGPVRDIVKMQREIIRSEGLEGEEIVEAWELDNPDYVPLKGHKDEGKGRTIGTGFNVKKSGTKSALGRTSEADNILAHLFAQVGDTIIRAEKVKVSRAFLKMVEENPNADLWQVHETYPMRRAKVNGKVQEVTDLTFPQKDNVLTVTKEDGSVVYVEMFDDDLSRVMKNLTPNQHGKVTQALATVTRTLSMLNTSLNPEFVVTNFERDIQTAMVHLSGEHSAALARKVVKSIPSSMRGIYNALRGDKSHDMAKWYARYKKAGGQVSFMDLRGVDDIQKQIAKSVQASQDGGHKALQAVQAIGKGIGDLNTVVENAVRLSSFKAAIEAGMSESDAASLAKNLTVNFNRKGELGPAMNALYMFFNAGVQGTARIFTALKHPRVAKMMGAVVLTAWGLAELNRMLAGDDDDGENKWDKVSDYTKSTNLIFMRDDGTAFKIKMPYGYNAFVALGYTMSDLYHYASGDGGKAPATAATNMVKALLNAFNPMGDDSFLQMLSPTVLDPFVQVATNENFMGTKIKPENLPWGAQKPESQLYFRSVSKPAKAISEQLNALTGGDKWTPGLVDVSPEILDHFMDFAFGGLGRTFKDTLALPATLSDPDVPVNRVPFLRQVYMQPSNRVDLDRFYDNIQQIEQARANLKETPGKRRDIMTEHPEVRLYSLVQPTKNRLSFLRKQMYAAQDAGDKEQAKKLEEMIHEVVLRFNKQYNKVTHGHGN